MCDKLKKNDFVKESVFPLSIAAQCGNVFNASSLLIRKQLQITTNERDTVILQNSKNGKNAYILLDFGKELHASIRILTFSAVGNENVQLRIVYGESVSEAMSKIGEKNSRNDHSPRDFTVQIQSLSDVTLNQSGFRFAKIELLGKNTEIQIKAITAEAVYRDLEYKGTFESSNETLNKIYKTAAYTCQLNMQQYLWDGIKRDRLVWVGDMHPEILTIQAVFGPHPIVDASVRFAREAYPLPEWINSMPTYSLWWLIIVRDWYFYTGNEEFLNENKTYISELSEIISSIVNDDGTDSLPSYFLDWPCHDKKEEISGSRALLCIALKASQELCTIFGYTAISEKCRKKRDILLKTEDKAYGAKQVIAMLSLAEKINHFDAGKEILKNGAEGFSTFMSYYLLDAAAEYSLEGALNALEDYYGGMLKMGATSFWEDFSLDWLSNAAPIDKIVPDGKSDIHGDNGAFCYVGFRHSLCHGWSSAPTMFLAKRVLGIEILEAGCKKVRIKPCLANLSYANGTFPTPYGIISVSCKKSGDKTEFTYTAPDEIEIISGEQ